MTLEPLFMVLLKQFQGTQNRCDAIHAIGQSIVYLADSLQELLLGLY